MLTFHHQRLLVKIDLPFQYKVADFDESLHKATLTHSAFQNCARSVVYMVPAVLDRGLSIHPANIRAIQNSP